MEKEYLNILKLNLEIIKVKNHITQINAAEDVKNKIDDYLFFSDENHDFQLNEDLLNYNFSQYEILNILQDYLADINEKISFESFKDSFNIRLDEKFINIAWPKAIYRSIFSNSDNSNLIGFEFDEGDIDKIVSQIKIDKFIQEPVDGDLVEDFNEFKGLPIFKFISNDLSDYEKSKLMERIELDINSGKVSGEITDIIDYYFEEYKVDKKHYLLNAYLNVIIKDELFDELIIKYGYDDEVILIILNKVRNDIYKDKIIDKKELVFKLKDYFKRQQLKTEFYHEIKEYEADVNRFCEEYNLTENEVLDVLADIRKDIENDSILNDSIEDHIHNKFDRLVELNQSDARIKFNNVIKQEKVVELIRNNRISNYLNDEIGDLIYNNQIRSYQITEKFIIRKIKEYRGVLYDS